MGRLLVLSWMLAAAGACDAEPLATLCPSTAPSIGGLEVTRCEKRWDAILIRYASPPSVSPFATDFDRRFVVVALGPTAKSVERVAGIEYPSGRIRRTALAEPPMAEGARRVMQDGSSVHRAWTVFVEKIHYPIGREADYGYVINCATAVRLRSGHYAAVSECFPLEGRSDFLKVLDSVN